MSRRLFVIWFEDEHAITSAAKAARGAGYSIVEAYTPFAVHGLDTAIGMRPTRLAWITLALGLGGAAFKLWFQVWTSSVDWPINIGGKPMNSLPAFVPLTFEVMVLAAGVGSVLAFLIISGLMPGRKPRVVYNRASNDQFVLVVAENDATFDPDKARRLFEQHGAVSAEERIEQE